MGMNYCSSLSSSSSSISSTSSSQIPLIMQHHHHHQYQHHPFYNHTTTFNHVLPCPTGDHHPFHLPPPPSPPSSHGGNLFKRVVDGLQFAYESSNTTTITTNTSLLTGHLNIQPEPDLFRLQNESCTNNNIMTGQQIADAKAIAASKSHSEAERRRRERINNHLTKLRSLLPNTTKTDKASLLAEVIEHVKELKSQTSIIAEKVPVPSEIDELTIDNTSDDEGRIVIRASLCCEDRSDLLQDLIKTLKMLRLRTLKAEITTLGRRVRNVLFVTGEDHHSISIHDNQQMVNHWRNVIEEALKTIVEKTNNGDDYSFASIKRQKNK